MIRKKSNSETQIDSQQQFNEKCTRKSSAKMPSSDHHHHLDPFNSNTQNLNKESDNPWITSGPLGSRDAVLVFRTSVFNIQKDENNSDDCNEQIPSTSNVLNKIINEDDNDDENEDENNDNNDDDDDDDNNDDDDDNVNDTKNKNGDIIKEKFSLPPQQNNSKNSLSSDHNINNSNNKKPKINNLSDKLNKQKQQQQKHKPITSPKKRLHESISSSENSISSECDDPIEIDDDFVKAVTNTLSQQKQKQQQQQNIVNTSLDDKENINSSDSEYLSCVTNEMPGSKLKITYKLLNNETKLLKKIFIGHGLIEAEDDQQFNILWTGTHIKPDILRNLTPYQRVNHFPRSYELTRKDRLYKNIVKMQHLRGYKHFDIVPQSFILPLEYRDLVTAHNKHRGPWIVKPAASSCGRGIFIVQSPDQIQTEEQVLVSKYIADPLCIDGHKCDLRVYVAVTSFDPLIIYMYEEGLVRLATVKYDRNAENLWNPCMHLCNYSINKYHSDYIKANDAGEEDVGHKWTLSALLRHLKNQGCDIKQLMSNIEDVIIKSMFACAQSIISACRMFVPSGNNCFELYGFDILIDDNLKPWLLEINLSPSLGIDSPLDAKVKASLIADLLTLIGIPAYSPAMRLQYDSKWTRFRGYTTGRRANSADHLNSSNGKRNFSNNQSIKSLSNEELKIIKNVKLQNARRGGFVRIFPSNDSMQRYGSFLDPVTGIPLSMTPSNGSGAFSMSVPHNFNYLLFNYLFNNPNDKDKMIDSLDNRMEQYERILETSEINLGQNKKIIQKCHKEGKRLRKQLCRLIENGNELTQLQARQAFSQYLECVLKRLRQEPRNYHEKLILKFINRISDNFRIPPVFFLQNPLNYQITGKDRSAMIAKLLGDFLQTYNRDTESYIDTFDNYNMIPIKLFNEFLLQAEENDLETILTLHTNLTQCMPFLYTRCGINVPPTPPIPTGLYGFLKALPNMVPCGYSRDQIKIDSYYKNLIASNTTGISGATSGNVTTTTTTKDNIDKNNTESSLDKTLKSKTTATSTVPLASCKKKIQQQQQQNTATFLSGVSNKR